MAIERIEKYAAQCRENFENNELVQAWISLYLGIVGEAARALPDSLNAYPIRRGMHIHPALSEVVERAFGSLMPPVRYHHTLKHFQLEG